MPEPLVRPDDLEVVAEVVVDVCRQGVDQDWEQRAGALDWTVRQTIVHMTSTSVFYAMHLVAEGHAELPITLASVGVPSNTELLGSLRAAPRVLMAVARAMPPNTRGHHVAGRADVEGFLAMACSELLVHVQDVTAGLGLAFDGPEDICERVVTRLFPWTPVQLSPREALLWANGRAPHWDPGEGSPRAWQCAPLDS